MRLENKIALITGAGSGMGRLACEVFAREGAAVVATDVNADAVRETADGVSKAGGRIVALAGDVRKAGDVRGWVEEGVRAFGKLDVLYNNAGIFPDEDGSVADMDEATYERVLDVNLRGVMLCCKYGVPELIRAGGGSIVNVASFVALLGCSVPQDATPRARARCSRLPDRSRCSTGGRTFARTRSARARSRRRSCASCSATRPPATCG